MTGLDRRILTTFFLFTAILGVGQACHGETLSGLFEKAYITPLQRPLKAHDLTLPDIYGNDVRLSDFQGKIVLLNFWATWCAPCREEMPSIERLHRHFREQNLSIVAVSVDMADIESVRAFVEKQKYTFTVLHDPRAKVMGAFRVRFIPVSYLIDKSGKVIGKAIGLRDWSQPPMIRLFEELLKKSNDK